MRLYIHTPPKPRSVSLNLSPQNAGVHVNTFLLYAPMFLLGLIIILVVAGLLWKFGNVFTSVKDFLWRCFGACVFYAVGVGVAAAAGGILEIVCYPMIQADMMYTGIYVRMMHAPMLYILLGLGSLFIAMPDSWATSLGGQYVSWLISGCMFLFVVCYALGVFPPPSMWTSDSYLALDPAMQAALKWLWPPLYPGVPGFADGC